MQTHLPFISAAAVWQEEHISTTFDTPNLEFLKYVMMHSGWRIAVLFLVLALQSCSAFYVSPAAGFVRPTAAVTRHRHDVSSLGRPTSHAQVSTAVRCVGKSVVG